MSKEIIIDGMIYKKSSYSPNRDHAKCVGVSLSGDKVYVVNTFKQNKIVAFKNEEWRAFIKGVKAGEFDV